MTSAEVTAYIALGSNLGDRRAHLAAALAALRATRGIEVIAVSPLFETAPVGPPPQGAYLNAAAKLATRLDAPALLARLHEIEAAEGRERRSERDLPRSLDLDLLLHADLKLDAPDLTVPHPRLHQRCFVLEPLRSIAAEVVHPVLGETIDTLARRTRECLGAAFETDVRLLEEDEWPSSQ